MSLQGDTLTLPTAAVFEPLLHPARYKAIHGGRAKGASHFFAELLVERCLEKKTDAVCLREIQRSLAQSSKKLINEKIDSLGVSAAFDVKDDFIRAPHGGLIIFQGLQSHTAETIKSLEGYDVAWTAEAQSISQTSLDILRPTIRKPGSELWFDWNPNFDTDPIDVLLRNPAQRPPGAVVVEASYLDNPWLPEEMRLEMEYDRKRDPDKFQHIWLGGYRRNSAAAVFKNYAVEEFDTDPEWIIRQGADWGFSIDPTVMVQVAIVGRKLYIIDEAYRVGCEIVDTPALFQGLKDSEKWPTVADSSRPETISHMQKNGFPKMVKAIKGARSLEEGVEFIKGFDVIIHPRCVHTASEFALYSFVVDKLTGIVLPVLADKDNHVIDAVRYAVEGARRAMRARDADMPAKPPRPQQRAGVYAG